MLKGEMIIAMERDVVTIDIGLVTCLSMDKGSAYICEQL